MSSKNLSLVLLTLISIWGLVWSVINGVIILTDGFEYVGRRPTRALWIDADWLEPARYGSICLPALFAICLFVNRRAIAKAISGPGTGESSVISGPTLRRSALSLYGVFLVMTSVSSLCWTAATDTRLWEKSMADTGAQRVVYPSIRMLLGTLLLVFCPLLGMVLRQNGEAEEDFV